MQASGKFMDIFLGRVKIISKAKDASRIIIKTTFLFYLLNYSLPILICQGKTAQLRNKQTQTYPTNKSQQQQ